MHEKASDYHYVEFGLDVGEDLREISEREISVCSVVTHECAIVSVDENATATSSFRIIDLKI